MLRRCCQTFLFIVFSIAMIVPSIARAAGKPNIVLVTLGSTRADRMGFLGAKTKTSLNLDGLAGHSVVRTRRFCPELILKRIAPANLETGCRQLFRSFPICSTHGATARLRLSGQSHWIRKTGSLPASIADFQLTTPDFSLPGRDRAKPTPPPDRPPRSWLAGPPGCLIILKDLFSCGST
jgi:hypothetical protein